MTALFCAMCLFAILASGTSALAQSYRLAPGDRVLVQIVQLGNLSYVGTVGTAGNIRLPYLGTHQAAGKTLDELAQEISLAVAGQQIRTSQDGVSTVIVLDEQDIFLDIETYRPVTVVGAVAAPGRLPFEPGMNVRAAIGSAGGTSTSGQRDGVQQANFRLRMAELRETEAWMAAELWRIDTLLTGKDSGAPIDGDFKVITQRLDDDDIVDLRRLVDGARDGVQRARDDNSARIALTEKRIDFLETALEQFITASEIEESRLQDVLQLSDRGLTTVNALDNAREGALNASSRLLTTQADLAAAERDLQTLEIEKQGLDADFVQTLLDERGRAEREYDEVRARIATLNRELALGALSEQEDEQTQIQILLHRQNSAGEITTEVRPSELLEPGDVVEVVLMLE